MARGIGAWALLLCLWLASAADAAVPPGSVLLSDERTITRWAHPASTDPIRMEPKPGSWPIGSLHFVTEDGYDEVYPLLRRWTDLKGREWVQLRFPTSDSVRTGWVEAGALGPVQVVKTLLIVNRRRLKATLFRSGQRVWWSLIGVGAPGTPTPAGEFWIRELIRVDKRNGPYGPWAFGTSAYSRLSEWPGAGVIGIHGTNQPQLIPGRPSHGCIRMPNRKINRLARLMPLGTPLLIR